MPKLASLAALFASVVALLLLALSPLGWRLGWWHYGFALEWLMPASGYVAAAAVLVAVLTLVLAWSRLRMQGLAMLAVAIVLGAALVYVPWQYRRVRMTVPPIHDITTDTDNPPLFSAVLPARAAERAGSVDYDRAQLPRIQKAAYPDVASLKTALPAAQAFDEALHVANSMPRWTVVASDPNAGRIEASEQSRWFRFTDDIVIRISVDQAGSRIDMRSTSRHGRSDFGVNAARIRAYMGVLQKRVGEKSPRPSS